MFHNLTNVEMLLLANILEMIEEDFNEDINEPIKAEVNTVFGLIKTSIKLDDKFKDGYKFLYERHDVLKSILNKLAPSIDILREDKEVKEKVDYLLLGDDDGFENDYYEDED